MKKFEPVTIYTVDKKVNSNYIRAVDNTQIPLNERIYPFTGFDQNLSCIPLIKFLINLFNIQIDTQISTILYAICTLGY